MPQPVSTKLGTTSGVYVPVVLNILSILMFLRFGSILGTIGLLGFLGQFCSTCLCAIMCPAN